MGKIFSNDSGFKPYSVQASIPDLNIRKGPGTNYAATGKGVFTITAESSGKGSAVKIPSKIDGKKVTSIGEYAFSNLDSLKSVTILGSVKSIEIIRSKIAIVLNQ